MLAFYYKDWQIDNIKKYWTRSQVQFPDRSIVSEAEEAIMEQWIQHSYRKVTLWADDKEWEKVKACGVRQFMVVDSGLTEIPSGSETMIILWPMLKSARPKIIKRLRATKAKVTP